MDKTVNEKIADLLAEQTYAERMEMAESFRDMMNDWLSDKNVGREFQTINRDDVALWIESYLDSFDDGEGGVHG